MMLVNFILILIGLALLSMCVNLIQQALEKFIEQLLEEYIEEIEKMAQIVVEPSSYQQEEAKPFEVGMTGKIVVIIYLIFSRNVDISIANNNRTSTSWDWIY